jgi:hypothetical protein
MSGKKVVECLQHLSQQQPLPRITVTMAQVQQGHGCLGFWEWVQLRVIRPKPAERICGSFNGRLRTMPQLGTLLLTDRCQTKLERWRQDYSNHDRIAPWEI